jgi:hypothetical protein
MSCSARALSLVRVSEGTATECSGLLLLLLLQGPLYLHGALVGRVPPHHAVAGHGLRRGWAGQSGNRVIGLSGTRPRAAHGSRVRRGGRGAGGSGADRRSSAACRRHVGPLPPLSLSRACPSRPLAGSCARSPLPRSPLPRTLQTPLHLCPEPCTREFRVGSCFPLTFFFLFLLSFLLLSFPSSSF